MRKLAIFLLLVGCAKPAVVDHRAYPSMGTIFTISIWGGTAEERSKAFEDASQEVDRIEALMSTYRPDSEISQINRSSGTIPRHISQDMVNLLTISQKVWEMSGGAFDPTVGPLVDLWQMNQAWHG